MRRILVAVDGTRASHSAAHLALEYAVRLGARVTFLHVLPAQVAGAAGEAPDFASFESACETYARELLEETAKLGGTAGLSATTQVEYGDPSEAILGAASAEDVDLVIMGARDRGPLARMLLGSVSSDLIARCPKPVMVVPERTLSAEPQEPRPPAVSRL